MTQQPKTDWLDALKEEIVADLMPEIDPCDEQDKAYFCGVLNAIDQLAQRGMLVPDGWVAVPREPTKEILTALKAAHAAFQVPSDSVIYNMAEAAIEKAIAEAEKVK